MALYELESASLVERLPQYQENKDSVAEFLEWAGSLRNVSATFYEAITEVRTSAKLPVGR